MSSSFVKFVTDKKKQVVFFSATAIALYGYDQGMMSLINTNSDYLETMGISKNDPLVGVIVSIYYLGTAVGAVLFSWLADRYGRKPGLFGCLSTTAIGNLIMFVAGIGNTPGALPVMMVGRVIMGIGVGGVDSVVPVYSSELNEDDSRGKALAQEFQSNIFGLNMAFAINLGITVALGKENEWAWRVPIICMQVYPILLLSFISELPESPRWFVSHERNEDAKKSLDKIYGEDEGKKKCDELVESHKNESDKSVSYTNMFTPGHDQFHPTMITIMGQINQALTGYGAVSVYGPQIFELLGFSTRKSEYLTQGNYISYFFLMTFAWLLVDAVGRRSVLLWGSTALTGCFVLLAIFGGLVQESDRFGISNIDAVAIPGIVALYVATGAFGIGWLATIWVSPAVFLALMQILTPTAHSNGDLPNDRPRSRNSHQCRYLGSCQFCRDSTHTHRVYQSQLLALPRLCRHQLVRRRLDLLLLS